MRVLVVGAGAVGKVYGWALRRAGCELGYLVKPKYLKTVRAGFDVVPLNGPGRDARAQITPDTVVTGEADLGTWDVVVLTVSSTALRASEWLRPITDALPNATVVCLQPALEDRRFVDERVSADRVLHSTITFSAWDAPLSGESDPRFDPPALALWHIPFTPNPVSGPRERRDAWVSTLKRGGLPMTTHRDVRLTAGFPNAVGMPHLLALELEGWSFAKLRSSSWLAVAAEGVREGVAAYCAEYDQRPPLLLHLVQPWLLAPASRLAPAFIPFDFERFVEKHFTKVGDQTRDIVRTLITQGQRHGLKTSALEQLVNAVDPPG